MHIAPTIANVFLSDFFNLLPPAYIALVFCFDFLDSLVQILILRHVDVVLLCIFDYCSGKSLNL